MIEIEAKPFYWREMFTGNWELFEKVLKNPKTIFVYDIDGILADSPKTVLKKFTEKTGIRTNPTDIDEWNYLTNLAKKAGLNGNKYSFRQNNAEFSARTAYCDQKIPRTSSSHVSLNVYG
jgi:hypothetical protein